MKYQNFSMYSQIIEKSGSVYSSNVTVLYCISGELSISINKLNREIKKGEFIIIGNGDYYQITNSYHAMGYYFEIDPQVFAQAINSDMYFVMTDSLKQNKDTSQIVSVLNELVFNKLQEDKQSDLDLKMIGLFYKLSSLILKNYIVKLDGKENSSDIRVLKIRSYIQANYKKKLELNDLADHLYISKGYLSRFFKKEFGCGFLTYLNNIRLYQVVNDLVNSDESIVDIAMNNGFYSISGFNRIFKKKFKMTPREYRKQTKESRFSKKEILENTTKKYLKDNQSAISSSKTDRLNETRNILIDVKNTKKTVLNKNWSQLINLGDAVSLLKAQDQENNKIVLKNLNFKYARFWKIFNTLKYTKNQLNNQTNYNNVDNLIDYLLGLGIKPFMVVGPKTKVPPSGQCDEDYKGIGQYTDIALWGRLLKSFLDHLINRYGPKEVESWYFELWKPNRYESSYTKDYMEKWYLQWMSNTIKIFRQRDEHLKIGGCQFLMIQNEKKVFDDTQKIMDLWRSLDFKPNFISICAFPYEGSKISTHLNKIKEEVFEAKMLFAQYAKVPLFVTEWNDTVSNRQPLNDTSYKGAYIIRTLLNELKNVDYAGYWVATDNYSDSYDSEPILHGGAGLISNKGLKKPAYFALSFLNMLDDFVLYRGENIIVTSNQKGRYNMIMSLKKPLSSLYYHNLDKVTYENYKQFFIDNKPINYSIDLTGFEPGKYSIRSRTVDQEHGNLLKLWQNFDYSTALSKEDERYISSLNIPKLEVKKIASDGKLHLHEKLSPNSFKIITISKKK